MEMEVEVETMEAGIVGMETETMETMETMETTGTGTGTVRTRVLTKFVNFVLE